jgi:ABC-type sugar transport system ATPase subunit
VEQPDSGELWVAGAHVPRARASEMIHHGIQVI